MSGTKYLGIFLILISIWAIYLNSQGQLIPTMRAITGGVSNTVSKTSISGVGKFILALVVYVIALSFLSPVAGFWLTIILVLGALLVNNQQAKANGGMSVLDQLFGPLTPGSLPTGGNPLTNTGLNIMSTPLSNAGSGFNWQQYIPSGVNV